MEWGEQCAIVVMAIHEIYLKGKSFKYFANAKHALQDAGREFDFEQLNYKGVQLAIEAEKNQVSLTLLLRVLFLLDFYWQEALLSELSDSVTTM